ncbi:MAG TPA: hypothetical protein VFN88_01350 [Caulobacteraceae bacterium]|nr:hypothetical protein [Caulobacteraceae bacterium]
MPAAPTPRDERLLATLERLTEIGMAMAEALKDEVDAQTVGPTADQALRFSRIARAVRQSVGLEHRLAKDGERAGAADPIGERIARTVEIGRRRLDGFKRKVQLAEMVAHVVDETTDEDGEDREYAYERLDAFVEPTEHDDLFLDRPAGEIIIEICEGLEIVPPDSPDFDRAAWQAAVLERYACLDPRPVTPSMAASMHEDTPAFATGPPV